MSELIVVEKLFYNDEHLNMKTMCILIIFGDNLSRIQIGGEAYDS